MMNRRYFLASSIAGAAATAASVKAAGTEVRIGMIGVGGRGTALLTQELPKSASSVKVTHLCDIDQARLEKAQAAAAKAGFGSGIRGSADLRRVLEDKNVDAV